MPQRDIVVVGASAGGLAPLRDLAWGLPADFAGSVFVVLHLSPEVDTYLAQILARAGPLPAVEVVDDLPIEPGRIYVASRDRHLVVEPGRVRSVIGPRENRHRPSIDVLFRSAAAAYGDRVIGVVLSGALSDGTAGLHAVKTAGGVTVVQDPEEAEQPWMPASAMRGAPIDHCTQVEKIPALLVALSAEPAGERAPAPVLPLAQRAKTGPVAHFACPDCNGTLFEVREGELLRFRCRVGHSFTEDGVASANAANLERALWTALRILEERADLHGRLAAEARLRGLAGLTKMHGDNVRRAEEDAAVLRRVVGETMRRETGSE